MKTIQITAPGKLELQDLPRRPLKTFEMRIGVVVTCVCGSDLKIIKAPKYLPQVPGHEFAGVVLEGPSKLTANIISQPGDRVTAFPMMGCMNCNACSERNFRGCDSRKDLGFQIAGSFAEEVIVDARFAIPLLPEISFEQGALVEHLSCGYRLAHEIEEAFPSREIHIIIVGDGPIALGDLQCLRIRGYREITVIGKHPSRLMMSKYLGAARVLDCKMPSLQQDIAALSPIAACVLAAPAEMTIKQIVPFIRSGGTIYPQTCISDTTLLEMLGAARIRLGRAFAYEFEDFTQVMRLMKLGRLRTDFLLGTEILLSETPKMINSFYKKDHNFKILIRNDVSSWKNIT
jgi:threonine dehydrogenase-like Zn-dependent dehydrogenase